MFSRGSRVFECEFKTKLGQNWVKKRGVAEEVSRNRKNVKICRLFLGKVIKCIKGYQCRANILPVYGNEAKT